MKAKVHVNGTYQACIANYKPKNMKLRVREPNDDPEWELPDCSPHTNGCRFFRIHWCRASWHMLIHFLKFPIFSHLKCSLPCKCPPNTLSDNIYTKNIKSQICDLFLTNFYAVPTPLLHTWWAPVLLMTWTIDTKSVSCCTTFLIKLLHWAKTCVRTCQSSDTLNTTAFIIFLNRYLWFFSFFVPYCSWPYNSTMWIFGDLCSSNSCVWFSISLSVALSPFW